jgi:hypothetical protein
MTVKELIAELQKLPRETQDMPVHRADHEWHTRPITGKLSVYVPRPDFFSGEKYPLSVVIC